MKFRDDRRLSVVRPARALVLSAMAAGALAACSNDDNNAPPPPEVEPSLTFVHVMQPVDITPDGSLALLQQYNATGEFYFYRPASGSLEFVGEVGDGSIAAVTGISDDGQVTGFFLTDSIRAGLWSRAGGWQALPNTTFPEGCGIDVAGAWDVTADGQTVIGMLWDGCRVAAGHWNMTTGEGTMLQRIGAGWSPELPPDNRASKIAADGSLIGGWASTEATGRFPALWRADGTGFLVEGVPADVGGEVMAISTDGSMAAGYMGGDAFYWTPAGGLVNIGFLPSDDMFGGAVANAIAASNRLIFGVSGSPFFGTPQPFVWTQAAGMRPLVDVITAAELTIPEGTRLTNVLAASADGTIVLGQAMDADFNLMSFVLVLPESAYGL